MKEFSILKAELLEKAKAKDACASEYRKAAKAETEAELLEVISNNLGWCISNGAIDHEWMKGFDPEVYLASGIANTGKENTGWRNSGDSNSGYSNSGYSNSGDSNSGDSNSGYSNSGDSNSGDSNSGDRNSGDRNSGDRNSGNWNSGDRNSGNWNSGDWNSGDSNSGYRNSGAFCTDNNPKIILFNKQSEMTVREWENTKACRLMWDHLNPNIWVNESIMTDEEKERFPSYKTTGGYLKSIPYKEMWANMWHNLSDDSKREFTTIPNFDAPLFEEITGIKI